MSHNLENPQTKFYQKISSGYRDITFFSTHPKTLKNPKIWTLKFEYLEFRISDQNFLLDYVLWSLYEHFTTIKKLHRFHFKPILYLTRMAKENWRENLLRPNFDLKGPSFVINNPTSPRSKVGQDEKLSSSLKNRCNQSRDFYSLESAEKGLAAVIKFAERMRVWGGKRSQATALSRTDGRSALTRSISGIPERYSGCCGAQRVRSAETMPADARYWFCLNFGICRICVSLLSLFSSLGSNSE
jgi:hypothetical protein